MYVVCSIVFLFFGSVWEGGCNSNTLFKVLTFFKCDKHLRSFLFCNLLTKNAKGNYITTDCISSMYF